jgi:hypothetical protein
MGLSKFWHRVGRKDVHVFPCADALRADDRGICGFAGSVVRFFSKKVAIFELAIYFLFLCQAHKMLQTGKKFKWLHRANSILILP